MEEINNSEQNSPRQKKKAVGAMIGIIIILIIMLIGGILYLKQKIKERQNYIQNGIITPN